MEVLVEHNIIMRGQLMLWLAKVAVDFLVLVRFRPVGDNTALA